MKHTSASLRRFAILIAVCCAAAVPLGATAVDTGPGGLLVNKVDAGGPAEKAGIEVNDILTAVDGTQLRSPLDIIATLSRHKPGDIMKIDFDRGGNGAPVEVVLTLGASPDDASRPWMGLSVLTMFLLVPEGQGQPRGTSGQSGPPSV